MKEKDVLSMLCYRDKRNPDYSDIYDEDDNPTPRKECFCDNCFNDLDRLALEILKLRRAVKISELWFSDFSEDLRPFDNQPAADLQTIMMEALDD